MLSFCIFDKGINIAPVFVPIVIPLSIKDSIVVFAFDELCVDWLGFVFCFDYFFIEFFVDYLYVKDEN